MHDNILYMMERSASARNSLAVVWDCPRQCRMSTLLLYKTRSEKNMTSAMSPRASASSPTQQRTRPSRFVGKQACKLCKASPNLQSSSLAAFGVSRVFYGC